LSKIAFVFPGQASQFVGMGADLFQASPLAREYYKKASDLLEFNLTKISFEGPEEDLKQTRITQPAIFVLSVIINKLLAEKEIKPQMVAGHSLGEYSALVAADALQFEDALLLVKLRGELMQQAGNTNPGAMAAIIGLEEPLIDEICSEVSVENLVQPANYNAPNQIVISGTIKGVERAMNLAKEKGALKVVPLVVSGAFHSPLMNSAQEELKNALTDTKICDPAIPVYTNVTAEPVTEAAQIRSALYKQVTHPVKWDQSVQNMIGDGAETFYEVGPGKVLTSLIKRNYRNVNVIPVGDWAGITALTL